MRPRGNFDFVGSRARLNTTPAPKHVLFRPLTKTSKVRPSSGLEIQLAKL